MRAAAVLLMLIVATPALAQVRLTEAEGRAVWRERSAAVLDAIATVETIRVCKIVNGDDAGFAMQRLEGMASNVFWRTPGISTSVPDSVMVEGVELAVLHGRKLADADSCKVLRHNPATTGNLKSWVAQIAGGRF